MKIRLWIALIGFLMMQPCLAENLLAAYQQALESDPTFKVAEAQWEAARQLAPISRALLLPSLSGKASTSRSHTDQNLDNVSTIFYQTTKQYSLNLSQILFDYKAWGGLKNANAQVKQGRATYNAAAQNLMLRVATAYLGVLQAYDQWLATQAQKRSLTQQLEQTRAQYQVGLIAITGLEQVKASYDATLAQEIANQNIISNKLEELRAITGAFYTRIAGITADLPLVSPNPSRINDWTDIAAQQNYTLQAANYGMVAARENVKIQRAGHFPSITATGNYSYDNQTGSTVDGSELAPSSDRVASVGVDVNFPIYHGGLVTAQTRQAGAQYAAASAQMEQTYRSTLTQTREAYLGVISGISKLKADKQAIVSNQSSLDATKAGYTAGNNTIVDVLQQQYSLYAAQTNYATDQYSYLLNILNLKLAAGTLSPSDLGQIDTWLTRRIDLSAYDFNQHEPTVVHSGIPQKTAPQKVTPHKKKRTKKSTS